MKRLIMVAACCIVTLSASAQSLWTSAELKTKLAKDFSGSIEAEYRTFDSFSGSERWAGTLSLDYKVCKYFKVSGGYVIMSRHYDERTTSKGNIVDDYWLPRHRVFVAATGSIDAGRFTFSLRERYQYTYSDDKYVSKYDGDDGLQMSDEHIKAKNRNILRSRFEIEYDIRKCPLTPFVSAEIYNDLGNSLSYEKVRFTVGTDYKINKKHSLSLFYRYIDNSDSDEDAGHIIGLGYRLKL